MDENALVGYDRRMGARIEHTARQQHRKPIPLWGYKALLVLAAAIWGLGTVVVKETVNALPPLWLAGIRLFFAGVILTIVCFKIIRTHIDRDSIVAGAFLGVFLALSYATNTLGLSATTAAKSAFITTTYCAFVPFFAWAISRIRPTVFNIAAMLLCVAGVAFVSFSNGFEELTFGFGEAITVVSAAFLALHIAFTAKLSDGRDPLTLTAVQFLVGGAIGIVMGLCAEGVPDWSVLQDPATFGNVVYIVVFATCIALLLQNIGVAHVPPAPAALFLAMECVFGVIFSVLLLGEIITPFMSIGFVLIGAGIVVSEALPLKKRRLNPDEVAEEERRASEEG